MNNIYNAEWHDRHKLTEQATVEQKIKWHIEHARRCPCWYSDRDIKDELTKRYLGRHQDFWIEHNIIDHRNLGNWIAGFTEKYIPYFESGYPGDSRPADAIKILREWADTGVFSMSVIRGASLASHSAARNTGKHDYSARYAAHAAGQAVATAHVPTHAVGAVIYIFKIITVSHPENIKSEIEKERELQIGLLPHNLRPWITYWLDKTLALLPIFRESPHKITE